MVKIDEIDRLILYHLNLDSRQSYTDIGRKVGLHENVVAYRIKRLDKYNVITSFYTVIDEYKLGYISVRFHYNFQYLTPTIEKKILDYLTLNKYTSLVATTEGMFDLSIIIKTRDIINVYDFFQDFQYRFDYYINKQTLTHFISEENFPLSYLLTDSTQHTDAIKYGVEGDRKQIKIDDFDIKILNIIGPNARTPVSKIAEILGISNARIRYRLTNLMKSGVIQGFKTSIDLSKLGYQSFKVYVFLKNYKERYKIIDYIRYHPNLICIDSTTGESDLELEFHLKNQEQLKKIMEKIGIKFPESIKYYRYVLLKTMYKFTYAPLNI